MNLANKLTLTRIILVPIFAIFISIKEIPYGTIIATIIFIIATITDGLDGHIARSRNQITTFGKFMDPLADKILVITALVYFVDFQIISSWLVIIIIAREFAISGLRLIAASNNTVIAASKFGKIKTIFQITTIILFLIKICAINNLQMFNSLLISSYINKFLEVIPSMFLYAAVLMTIISGIDYFIKNKQCLTLN